MLTHFVKGRPFGLSDWSDRFYGKQGQVGSRPTAPSWTQVKFKSWLACVEGKTSELCIVMPIYRAREEILFSQGDVIFNDSDLHAACKGEEFELIVVLLTDFQETT